MLFLSSTEPVIHHSVSVYYSAWQCGSRVFCTECLATFCCDGSFAGALQLDSLCCTEFIAESCWTVWGSHVMSVTAAQMSAATRQPLCWLPGWHMTNLYCSITKGMTSVPLCVMGVRNGLFTKGLSVVSLRNLERKKRKKITSD